MSLVSDEAIFHVADPEAVSETPTPAPHTNSIPEVPAPITYLEATTATPEKITLVWSEVSDASDYKLKWDKGDHQESSLFYSLVASTNGANTFTVDRTNSGGIMGSQRLRNEGGIFNFMVSYVSKTSNQESELSQPFEV
jgi:hypothetical protein